MTPPSNSVPNNQELSGTQYRIEERNARMRHRGNAQHAGASAIESTLTVDVENQRVIYSPHNINTNPIRKTPKHRYTFAFIRIILVRIILKEKGRMKP